MQVDGESDQPDAKTERSRLSAVIHRQEQVLAVLQPDQDSESIALCQSLIANAKVAISKLNAPQDQLKNLQAGQCRKTLNSDETATIQCESC